MLEQSKSGSNIKHSGKFLQPRRAERKRLGSVEKLLLCAIQRILYWTSITNVLDLFFLQARQYTTYRGDKKGSRSFVLFFCLFMPCLFALWLHDGRCALSFEALYTYRPTYTAQYRSFFFFASNTMQEMLRNTHKVRLLFSLSLFQFF